MPAFVDRCVLNVTAGNGGHGCVSVHREKFKPLGGPDGGNGGRGGDVTVRVDHQVTTLLDYHHSPHRKAGNGKPGEGGERNGADGASLVLPVPDGTVIATRRGEVLADLVGEGAEFVIARGGRGGLGNRALSSRRRKAPGFALLGEPGEQLEVVLELKTLADVALIGFPSAGKSSLVSVLSAAKPKIADYPFTTLVPNLGVVTAGSSRYTIADVPGLIPGAHEGRGLGLEFLRHVERCSVLAHVVDCATLEPGRDPMSDLDAIEHELSMYVPEASLGGRPLADRTRIVVLNKADVPEAAELAEFVRPELEARGLEVYIVSAVARTGLKELSFALARHVEQAREQLGVEQTDEPRRRVTVRPKAVDERGFDVRRENTDDGPLFHVVGDKTALWVHQTDFANDEAVGYLADRLARAGVEDALVKAGAVAGDTVLIGPENDPVVFDWQPTLSAGAELLGPMSGPRGSDVRFDERTRPSRAQKREEYDARRAAKAAARAELADDRKAGIWTDPSD